MTVLTGQISEPKAFSVKTNGSPVTAAWGESRKIPFLSQHMNVATSQSRKVAKSVFLGSTLQVVWGEEAGEVELRRSVWAADEAASMRYICDILMSKGLGSQVQDGGTDWLVGWLVGLLAEHMVRSELVYEDLAKQVPVVRGNGDRNLGSHVHVF